MCGIVGYVGDRQAAEFLLEGLSKLEYRGYDSAGSAVYDGENIRVEKCVGRLAALREKIKDDVPQGTVGIGHTRWATHGVPSNLNAHPHTNADGTISLVHNGIIENYTALKEKLERLGYVFQSATDSEAVVHLLDYEYRQCGVMLEALEKTLGQLKGSWALCIVTAFEPDTIYTARKESPMVLGHNEAGSFCASDAPAMLAYTHQICLMDDGDMAVLRPDGVKLYDADGNEKPLVPVEIPYDLEAAQKGGYDSFMLKEIHEQPEAIRETLRGRIGAHELKLNELEAMAVDWTSLREIVFIACGTAYHAGIYASTLLRRLTPLYAHALPASEFRYAHPRIDEHTLVIAISQSGETADTIAAIKLAKKMHCPTLGVVNVLGSSIARLCDAVLYTCAGPEISVASTKAYTTQLVLLHLVDLKIAQLTGDPVDDLEDRLRELSQLPAAAEAALSLEDQMTSYAAYLKDQRDAYFIGRQLDYPSALEGALKLKEISYIHADAYYAGELKHGPIALIENGTIVIALATQPDVAAKTISNIQETIARGARVILVTNPDADATGFSHVVRLPKCDPELVSIPAAIVLQLFAYAAAKEKGRDIDKPRNLAKSVTVE
ncbi:MAG TPA: glutamine--fructose-6-phosphate transaminase (isomerizing) [Erysipelotrichaceae bacterium]|nr:glutamine--fructose-6-phosphate transaminase (isomerizing) [Erysipelotrichaceae bacterium]